MKSMILKSAGADDFVFMQERITQHKLADEQPVLNDMLEELAASPLQGGD